jgi:hypothetical protein
MIARLRSEPTPLRQAMPQAEFPEAVERVLLRGMSRDADDRYSTAPEFAAALAQAATGRSEGGLLGRLFGR